ncbi:methylenetetrahydrofolate reductase-domain-containing protein [Catenaria anguillulae PL171]|uniref:Methylenetetrahydrofolate reductase-domain-containing protein n=1 Tax=Catenaria anguillulae PL171 TaxID=765915 RepID=A0A1Y2HPZ8_9FUNG|nr:methylenetetrahydrofolate reductase-domain-containing protein [Catenaria anguillulae PL171]
MKIIDKLRRAEAEDRITWSFEYFPPKTDQGIQNLYDRLDRMHALGPTFIDVTWAAGGSTADTTLDVCEYAQKVAGLEVCMHLTCTNMPKQMIDDALAKAREIGIQNILALRGDPPRGQERWTACEGGLSYAVDLVKYIRQTHGDYFGIAVAGYPEGHLENPDREDDLRRLKEKVDAGADYIITQMFYDCDMFVEWVAACRRIGITCPILPGIMPIQTYGGFQRMTSLSKTAVPQHIHDALEPIKDDDAQVKEYGIRLAMDMCTQLRQRAGISCFHMYTMNLERSVRLILEGLEWVAPREVVRPLPWTPSLAKKRVGESVRPIHWRNRPRSYISRTETWDEYSNGRWGDAASPAYGELDGYNTRLKQTKEEALAIWGKPSTPAQVRRVFVDFCQGAIRALPWSDFPLSGESNLIRTELAGANARGFLTINSQPAVNGKPSSDKLVGWGPRNGFVYQKAYIEAFVPRHVLDALEQELRECDPDAIVQYHAVNRDGSDLRSNHAADSPNAVTWGIFPGCEVKQPTVVDLTSFLAWKDEAFLLWDQWVNVVPEGENALLQEMASEWYLVTLVHNDFHEPSSALFDVLKRVARKVEGIPEEADAEEVLRIVAEAKKGEEVPAVSSLVDEKQSRATTTAAAAEGNVSEARNREAIAAL